MDFKGQLTQVSSDMRYPVGGDGLFWPFVLPRQGPNTLKNFIPEGTGAEVEHHSFFGHMAPLDELPGRLYMIGMTEVKVYLIGGDYYVVGLSPDGFLAGFKVSRGNPGLHD